MWRLIDALGDGVALTDDDGTIVAVNRRLTQMFGYEQAELTGRPVDMLVPADVRDAHRHHRASYAQASVSEQTQRGQELLDRVLGSLFRVGVSLQGAADLPREVAREHIADALRQLDQTIYDIRSHAFSARRHEPPPDGPPDIGAG